MKRRLILFLVIFGISLTLLTIFVQGDQVFREDDTKTISKQSEGLVGEGLQVQDGASKFRIGKLPKRIELPVGTKETWVDESGVEREFQRTKMVLPDTKLFDDGILSTSPVLSVFGETPEELTATIRSGLAMIYTHGPFDFESFGQDEMPDVRSVHLTETVVAEMFGTEKEPGLILTTEELSLEVPPGWKKAQGFPPIVIPKALEIRRSDDSLVLRGSGAEFDSVRRCIVIQPPVEVVAMVEGFEGQFQSLMERGLADDQPLILRCQGELEYQWAASEEETADQPQSSEDLRLAIGQGELTLRESVRAFQGDRWMESEFLRIAIGREELPPEEKDAPRPENGSAPDESAEKAAPSAPRYGYHLAELEAYDHRGRKPVRFALMGGTGRAGRVTVNREEGRLEFLDDVHFENLGFGEGEDRLVLQHVDSRETVSLHSVEENGETVRLEIVLQGSSSLAIADEVRASAERLTLHLVPGEQPVVKGGAPGDADDASSEPSSQRWTPEKLELRERSSLELLSEGKIRGEATAESIDSFKEADRQVLVLRGDARCIIDGAALEGPLVSADVLAPHVRLSWTEPEKAREGTTGPERAVESTPEVMFDLEVAELQEATFVLNGLSFDQLALPENEELSTEDPATEPGAEEAAAPLVQTTLHVTPVETCRLDATASEVHFLRRAEYQTVQADVVLQTVLADRFDATIPEEGAPDIKAFGDVIATSDADGFELRGDLVDFGQELVAEGSPATLDLSLEGRPTAKLSGDVLRFDPQNSSLSATMSGPGLVHLHGPAALIEDFFPAESNGDDSAEDAAPDAGLDAASDASDTGTPDVEAGEEDVPQTVDLWCRTLTATRSEPAPDQTTTPSSVLAAAERIPFSHFEAVGLVRVDRPDGSSLNGDRLDVDIDRAEMRLVGHPAVFSRPSSSDPERSERAEADWIEFTLEGEIPVLVVAPRAVLEFLLPASRFRESLPKGVKGDPLRRVRVQAGQSTTLRGNLLTTDGGVETLVFLANDTIRAFSERLEVQFDRSPFKGGVPQRAFARRFVTLDHPWFRCHGALLSFDFQEEWLELKAGVELCHVEGDSSVLPLQMEGMEATFRRLKCRLRDTKSRGDQRGLRRRVPIEELYIQQLGLRPRPSRLAAAVETGSR